METRTKTDSMLIGAVAASAGVNVQTVRYYERRGLLKPPARRATGYREYSQDTVREILFIQRAQELGFTLEEIRELLRLRDDSAASCTHVRRRTQAKIADIDRKINNLSAMKRALATLLDSCSSRASVRYCPIIEALSEIHNQEKGKSR